jgi:hypothetical protein
MNDSDASHSCISVELSPSCAEPEDPFPWRAILTTGFTAEKRFV